MQLKELRDGAKIQQYKEVDKKKMLSQRKQFLLQIKVVLCVVKPL